MTRLQGIISSNCNSENFRAPFDFILFFRPFEREWIDECEDVEFNKDTSERWTFPTNGTSGQLMEIPLLEWNTYIYNYYLIHIFIEPNVFQAVHGFHISNSKSHQELGEFEPIPREKICVYNPLSIENLMILQQGQNVIRHCYK